MSLTKLATSNTGAVLAIGLIGGFAIYYTTKKANETIVTVGNAINPVNQDNIFNRGVNSVVQNLTGDDNQTLGGWIYDITH
jgi:hypothetical protein